MSAESIDVKVKYPFLRFGMALLAARKEKKLAPSELAVKLGISRSDYNRFEYGEAFPSSELLSLISGILDVDFESFSASAQAKSTKKEPAAHPIHFTPPVAKQSPLSPTRFDAEWDRIMADVLKIRASNSDQTTILWKTALGKPQAASLESLKKITLNLFTVPVLPMNLYLIFLALGKKQHGTSTLREFKSPFSRDETLAEYISRDSHLAPFLFYAANLNYFQDCPATDILGCFNRLTLAQFKTLLFLLLAPRGIYDNVTVIPYLQEQMEFSSLAAFLVRKLAPHLEGQINPSHLSMGTLLQNLGKYVLLTILFPGGENPPSDPHLENFPEGEMSKHEVMYALHPLVSASLAAHLGFPEEVINAVLNHHAQPAESVSPLCAAIKLVDELTDREFFFSARDNLDSLISSVLKGLPQLDLSAKILLDTIDELKNCKRSLVEMASTALEDASSSTSDYADKQRTGMAERRKHLLTRGGGLFDPIRSEVRFDREYQRSLLPECQAQAANFKNQILSPEFSESSQDFGQRMASLLSQIFTTYGHDPYALSSHIRNALRGFFTPE